MPDAEKDAGLWPCITHGLAGCEKCWPRVAPPAESDAAAWRAEWRTLLADKAYQAALLATAGLMETQHISPECRASRTVDGAWDEAVRRLREIYDAQVAHDPTITLGLSIGRATSHGGSHA